MSKTNYANSFHDVVSSLAPVLKAFTDKVQIELNNCNVVYDEELSYETGVRKFLNDNNMEDKDLNPLPIFIYKVNALKHLDGIGTSRRLSQSKIVAKHDKNNTDIFVGTHAECEVQFMYVHNKRSLLEKFEITHLQEEGITGIKSLSVTKNFDGNDLGEFNYYLDHDIILDKTININNNSYKSVIGSLRIRGIYLTFREKGKLITSIKTDINNLDPEKVLESIESKE